MIFDFITYMENVAQQHKSIAHDPSNGNDHYFRVSGVAGLEELLSNINNASFPALCVVDNPEGRLVDQSSNNVVDRQFYYFFLLKPADSLDADSRQTAIDDCRTIARQILARMFRDYLKENRELTETTGLRYLQRDSITYKAIGPLGDNCHGMWVSFAVINRTGISFDKNMWSDEETES